MGVVVVLDQLCPLCPLGYLQFVDKGSMIWLETINLLGRIRGSWEPPGPPSWSPWDPLMSYPLFFFSCFYSHFSPSSCFPPSHLLPPPDPQLFLFASNELPVWDSEPFQPQGHYKNKIRLQHKADNEPRLSQFHYRIILFPLGVQMDQWKLEKIFPCGFMPSNSFPKEITKYSSNWRRSQIMAFFYLPNPSTFLRSHVVTVWEKIKKTKQKPCLN